MTQAQVQAICTAIAVMFLLGLVIYDHEKRVDLEEQVLVYELNRLDSDLKLTEFEIELFYLNNEISNLRLIIEYLK